MNNNLHQNNKLFALTQKKIQLKSIKRIKETIFKNNGAKNKVNQVYMRFKKNKQE